MKPEDRLDTRVASCHTMPVELKEEILAALSFYRQALYKARLEATNAHYKLEPLVDE